ncbi:histidine phosphatase family protein [Paenibacillus sp. WLX1005]|uniref:histidine phosphatase family protein n=1 Tax=Paenibacillus sp. WLX1005 TaxID=3243766 RepID=UPI003983E13D
MMTMQFFLVRHAVKEKAVGNVDITMEGISQAQKTAQYFDHMPITALISSPLQRAISTASYISQVTGAAVQVDQRLRERVNWGDLPEQTFQEFVEMWDRCTMEPHYIPPIGDSAHEAGERLFLLLMALINQYPKSSNIVMITHGGLITDYLTNFFPESILNKLRSDFILQQSQLVFECSITKLSYDGNTFSIDQFASTKHLQ